MAIYWVNKSGNDVNDGKSPNTAKLTIQAAVNAAVTGDTVIVQSGVYNESVSVNKEIMLRTDGLVVLDGQNALTNGIAMVGLAGNLKVVGFICINYTNAAFASGDRWTSHLENCQAFNCAYGLWINDNTGSGGGGTIKNCLFANMTSAGYLVVSSGHGQVFTNCTIANCPTGFGKGFSSISNCIVYNCGTIVDRSGVSSTATLNKNIYYPVGASNVLINSGITYTDMASWRTATGQDANSDAVDPLFLDPNNLLFSVANNSPAVYASLNPSSQPQPYPFVGIGAVNRRIGVSNNVNNTTIWDAATLTNVVKDADGSYKLVDPNVDGTIEFPEMDLQTLSGFTPAAGQTLGIKLTDLTQSINYPARVIDSTVGDSKPNRLTYQIRYSNTTPITTSYVDYEPNQLINFAARYIQIKVTLKATGVGG